MRSAVIFIASLSLVFAACGGDEDSDSGGEITTRRAELERREDELRDTVEGAIASFIEGDADEFYGYFSSSFRERCDVQEFRAILALAAVFMGDLSEREHDVQVTSVRFEDDRAFVEARVDVEGLDFGDDSDEGSFTDFWVLEDGDWKADTEDERPCDLGDGLFGDDATVTIADSDDDDVAPSGPGTTRGDAVPVGQSVTTGDLRVTVLAVNFDAAAELIAEDDFVDPPAAGNRYVLVTVRIEHAGDGDDTVSVSESNFELTGSRSVIYDTFDQDCDFFFGINGEMFAGGSLDGEVCFEVPEDESGLILIASPSFSFDGEGRRFLALE